MSQGLERMLEEVRNLTPDERRQLLEALHAAPPARVFPRLEIVDRVLGKYAHVHTSSDDFCAGKADEIALEDHSHLQ
jgi:hypothetical protein